MSVDRFAIERGRLLGRVTDPVHNHVVKTSQERHGSRRRAGVGLRAAGPSTASSTPGAIWTGPNVNVKEPGGDAPSGDGATPASGRVGLRGSPDWLTYYCNRDGNCGDQSQDEAAASHRPPPRRTNRTPWLSICHRSTKQEHANKSTTEGGQSSYPETRLLLGAGAPEGVTDLAARDGVVSSWRPFEIPHPKAPFGSPRALRRFPAHRRPGPRTGCSPTKRWCGRAHRSSMVRRACSGPPSRRVCVASSAG